MIYKLSLSKDLVVNFKTSLRDNYCVKVYSQKKYDIKA